MRRLFVKLNIMKIAVGACIMLIGHTRVMIIGMPAGKHLPDAVAVGRARLARFLRFLQRLLPGFAGTPDTADRT